VIEEKGESTETWKKLQEWVLGHDKEIEKRLNEWLETKKNSSSAEFIEETAKIIEDITKKMAKDKYGRDIPPKPGYYQKLALLYYGGKMGMDPEQLFKLVIEKIAQDGGN
jgi:hypothetical protein